MGVLDCILADKLNLRQLQQLLGVGDAVKDACEVGQGAFVADAGQRGKAVALAGGVGLGLDKGGEQLGGIGDQQRRVLEDGRDGKDGVLAHVGVAVLETGARRRQQRLNQLGLAQLAQEAQRVAANVLVGVLQVVADAVADQDHLLLELAGRVELGADLVVEVEQLLERLGLGRHHEPDDVHQDAGQRVAVEHDDKNATHRVLLRLVRALLQLVLQVVERRDVGRIVLVDEAVRPIEEGRHGGGVCRVVSGDGHGQREGGEEKQRSKCRSNVVMPPGPDGGASKTKGGERERRRRRRRKSGGDAALHKRRQQTTRRGKSNIQRKLSQYGSQLGLPLARQRACRGMMGNRVTLRVVMRRGSSLALWCVLPISQSIRTACQIGAPCLWLQACGGLPIGAVS